MAYFISADMDSAWSSASVSSYRFCSSIGSHFQEQDPRWLLSELHRCIALNDVDLVRTLVNVTLHVNAIFNDRTAFTLAIRAGHFDVANIIMDAPYFDPNARDGHDDFPLYLAVIAGNAGIVDRLFLGAKVNATGDHGCTALMACAQTNHYYIAQTLINHGAQIDKRDKMRRTFLHHVCLHAAVNVVRLPLQYPHMLNQKCARKITPLMYALPSRERSSKIYDKLLVSKALIKAGCDLNMRDPTGRTALHRAVAFKDMLGLCLLAESGCKLNIRDNSGHTPLHTAVSGRTPAFDIARFLLYYGADATLQLRELITAAPATILSVVINIRVAPEEPELLWSRDELLRLLQTCLYPSRAHLPYCDLDYYQNSSTPEHEMVKEVIQWLHVTQPCSLKHQTLLTVRRLLGSTNILPKINVLNIKSNLQYDLRLGLSSNWISLSEYWNLQYFIKTSSNRHVREIITGRDVNVILSNKTHLAIALEQRNVGAAIIILNKSNRNSFQMNSAEDAALHVVAEHGFHTISCIFQKYPQIDRLNSRGQTALHLAIHTGHFSIAAFLIQENSILVSGDDRMPLLNTAAACGALEIVWMLLEEGMDPNMQDRFGNTPLHVAASKGSAYTRRDIHVHVEYRERDAADLEYGLVASRNPASRFVLRDTDHAQVIRLLLHRGASLLQENAESWTPAMCAVEFGHIDLLYLLDVVRQ